MKNSPNLDDYFNKARNDEPIISKEEVRNLLREADRGRKTFWGNVLSQIKGVPLMYKLSIAAAFAASLGIMTLNFAGKNDIGNKQIYSSNSNITSTKTYPDEKKNIIPPENNNVELAAKDESTTKEKENNTNIIVQVKEQNNFDNLNIRGIHPVELSDEELQNLGIKLLPDCELQYWDNSEGKPQLVTILNNGGVSVKIDNNSNMEQVVPGFSPKLITDNSGNKRIFMFNDKDNESKIFGSLDENNDDENGIQIQNKKGNQKVKVNKEIKIISSNDTDVDSLKKRKMNLNYDFDYDYPDVKDSSSHKVIHKNIKVIVIDSNNNNGSLSKYKRHKIKSTIRLKMRVLDSALNLRSINLDSILAANKVNYDSIMSNIPRINFDSLMRHQPKINLDSIMKSITIFNFDSILINLPDVEIDTIINLDFDERMNGLDKNIKKFNLRIDDFDKNAGDYKKLMVVVNAIDKNKKIYYLDSTEPSVLRREPANFKTDTANFKWEMANLKWNLVDLGEKIDNIENNVDQYIKINELVPIIIQSKDWNCKKTKSGEPYAYYMWFDPTPEFLAQLPPQVRAKIEPELNALKSADNICESSSEAGKEPYFDVWRSCSGAVENLSVFPNPAKNYINFNYTLLDKRNVSVALHDLSGRIIKEFWTNEERNKGDWKESLKLDNVPSGMYLLSIRTNEGEQAVQRVIVE